MFHLKKLSTCILILASVVAVPSHAGVDSGTRKEVTARVQPLGADIKWNSKVIETLDINCDGTEDYAIAGRGDGRFVVAIVLGPLNQATSAVSFEAPVGPAGGDALCEKNPALMVLSMDYDPSELLGQVPEGFERSATCNELGLGGECVKYHIYWNKSTGRLTAWK